MTTNDRKVRLSPLGEGAWTLAGFILGIFLPVRNWLDIDLKVWVVFLAIVASLSMVVATKLLKFAFNDIPKEGWSIRSILVCANATGVSIWSRHLAGWAVSLLAIAAMLLGVLAGQAAAIVFWLGASHRYAG